MEENKLIIELAIIGSIVGIILILQTSSFVRTFNKIEEFKKAIPEVRFLSIAEICLTETDLQEFSDGNLLIHIDKYACSKTISNDADLGSTNLFTSHIKRIKVIDSANSQSPCFSNIQQSLNTYLIRNQNAVTDFNLIKDIVERNTDALEEEIDSTISAPLYWGLIGTVLGIVVGLVTIYRSVNLDDGNNEIKALLGGVMIAMIASFCGLLFTLINSSFIYKNAKSILDSKKNSFYTFIQVQLLPIINQDMGATFESLQRNLMRFNEKFDSNLNRLSNVFDKSYESMKFQKEIVEMLDKAKVSEMTRYNVTILKELKTATANFAGFNELFSNLNQYISGAYKLTDKTNELLDRTQNFKTIANDIDSRLKESEELMKFLTQNISDLESHKRIINGKIADVGEGIGMVLNKLQDFVENSSQSVRSATAKQSESIKEVFDKLTEEIKQSFLTQAETIRTTIDNNKSDLNYLKYLETLSNEVQQMKGSGNDMSGVSQKLDTLITELEEANKIVGRPILRRLFRVTRA